MATTSIIGTEEKFNLRIAPLGNLHAADYDFSVKAYSVKVNSLKANSLKANSGASIIITKEELIMVDEDNFIVTLDTNTLGLGQIVLEVTAYIPDLDFPDGLRTEIARYITDTQIIS